MINNPGTLSGGRLVIYAVVSICALLFGMFRLDEVIARKKRGHTPRVRRPMGHDAQGETMFTDPDGRTWGKRKR